MRNRFSDYPAWVIFIYYIGVIAFLILFIHPFFLLISFSIGLLYSALLNGMKKLLMQIAIALPTVVFLAVITPFLNNRGLTPILYVNSRAIMLESVLYGASTGIMIISVIIWFNCFHKTLGNDKFLYLFGKKFPVTALTVTMIFRFIPYFNSKLSEIISTQRILGISTTDGKLSDRLRNGGHILLALISISLEGSIETADSMMARGFGISKKKSGQRGYYSPKSVILLVMIIIFLIIFFAVYIRGTFSFYYFPRLKGIEVGIKEITLFSLYGLYLIIPIIIMIADGVYWRIRMGVLD